MGEAKLPSNIRNRIDRLQDEAQDRQLGLPFGDWSERLRAAPNAMLRSALFGVVKPGKRKYVKEMPLPMVGDFSLAYTGERLDQSDLDIYLQIIHFARQRTVHDELCFPIRRLLREIGRSTSGADYQWLHGRLVSLNACAMTIRDGKGRTLITGGLLRDSGLDETTGEMRCKLNPYLRGMFDDHTLIGWEDRLALGSKQLAKWLQAFYATHAAPFPMKVQTLSDLSGSQVGNLKEFRRSLKIAMSELESRRLIIAWNINAADLLHVSVEPSPSQARHLANQDT